LQEPGIQVETSQGNSNVGDTLKNPPAKVEQASKCRGKEEAVCTKKAQGHASSTEVIILMCPFARARNSG
jgi:hypothetical protein